MHIYSVYIYIPINYNNYDVNHSDMYFLNHNSVVISDTNISLAINHIIIFHGSQHHYGMINGLEMMIPWL
jgi:hypothetical protein